MGERLGSDDAKRSAPAESERLKAEQAHGLRRADLLVLYGAGALSAGAR
jgi:hypothetical protein